MSEFFKTRMGQKYYEHDIPMLIKQLGRLADSNERLVEMQMQKTDVKGVKCASVMVMTLSELNDVLVKLTSGYVAADVDIDTQSGLFFYVTEKGEDIFGKENFSRDIDAMTERQYIFGLLEKHFSDNVKITNIDVGSTLEQKVYIFYEKC